MSDGMHLELEERERLAAPKAEGLSLRAIALALGRAASTISRELRRNALPSTTAEVHGSLFDAASGSGGRAAGGGGASATSRGRPRGRAGAPRAGPRAAGAPRARSAAAAPRPGRAAPVPPTAAARTTAR